MCVESTQRQAAQISPPSCICSSGSVSFTSCFPHTNASFSLTDSPQQMHRIQFQPQKLNFFFCSLGGGGGGGGGGVCNLLLKRRDITGEQLKKENMGDSCMGGLHSQPSEPSRTAVKCDLCHKQTKCGAIAVGRKQTRQALDGGWRGGSGRMPKPGHPKPLCASFEWSDI